MTPFQRSGGIYVAAIFTAKVIHWKKNNVICKKVLFLLQRLKYIAEGAGVGEA